MTSRIFSQELYSVLTTNLSGGATVFIYDGNDVETLPAVIVGVDSEQRFQEGSGLFGNYVLQAFVIIKTNGYDDDNNDLAENLHTQVFNIFKAGYTSSCLDGLFHQGSDRVDADDSTTIIMRLEVFTHRTD